MHSFAPSRKKALSKLWITLVVLVCGGFLFYWFQLRPVSLYRFCAQQASTDARALARSKAAIAEGGPKEESYKSLVDQNLYLRSDYQSFLQKCLMYYGVSLDMMTEEEGNGDTDQNQGE